MGRLIRRLGAAALVVALDLAPADGSAQTLEALWDRCVNPEAPDPGVALGACNELLQRPGVLNQQDTAVVLVARGDVYFEDFKNVDRAFEDWERARIVDPSSRRSGQYWLALVERADQAMAFGFYDNAIDDYTAAIEGDPIIVLKGSWRFKRARAYRLSGQYARAIEELDPFVEANPHPEVLYERALAKLEARQTLGAMADLNRAVFLDPGDARARFARGVIKHSLGDAEEGWADIEEARRMRRGIDGDMIADRMAAPPDDRQAALPDRSDPSAASELTSASAASELTSRIPDAPPASAVGPTAESTGSDPPSWVVLLCVVSVIAWRVWRRNARPRTQ